MSTEKNIGLCTECGTEVRFKKAPYLGQVVECYHCNTYLEVTQRSPIRLEWAYEDVADETEDVRSRSAKRVPRKKNKFGSDSDDDWN